MTDFPNLKIGTPWGNEFIEGQPYVRRINKREFELTRPYMAMWDGGDLRIKTGYVMDLSSIPRILWPIFPKGGLHDGPSVFHDWGYEHKYRTRKWNDDLFLETMKVAGVEPFDRNAMYAGVRAFGWWVWMT